jgi:YD repeat-containing protein
VTRHCSPAGSNTTFYYDAARSPVRLVDAENNLTTAVYNNMGHRTSVTDPNRGTWAYQYNGFGELKKQLDARNLELNQSFDNLGRMTARSWQQPGRTNPSSTTPFSDSFVYNNTPGGQYGTLTSSSRAGEGTIAESYQYDALNRPIAKTYSGTNVASQNWSLQESSEYDPNFGRPVRKTYPAASGASAQSIYLGYTLGGDAMQTGFASDYLPSDPRSSSPARYLRRDEASNARGQMLTSRFGAGDRTQAFQWLVSEYDMSTGWLLSRCSNLVVCSGVSQLPQSSLDNAATMKLGYAMDAFGNLKTSVNIGKRPANVVNDVRLESFGYDPLHRMVGAVRTGQPQVDYSYSPVGNLLSKSDFGSNYQYTDSVHKHGVKQVTLNTGGTKNYSYDANGNVNARGNNNALTESFGFDIDNRPQFTSTINSKGASSRIEFYLSASGAKALQIAGSRTIIYAGSYEAEYSFSTLIASRTYLAEGVLHNGVGDAV